MTAREALRERLEYLCSLPRGWLDGDGEPVPLVVAAYVDRWLTEAPDDEFAGWTMGPIEEGGIRLERAERCADASLIDDSAHIDAQSIVFHRYVRRYEPDPFDWGGLIEIDLCTGEAIEVDGDPIG